MSKNQQKRDARAREKRLRTEHPVSCRVATTLSVGAYASLEVRKVIDRWTDGAHIQIEDDGAVVFSCAGQRYRARIERVEEGKVSES